MMKNKKLQIKGVRVRTKISSRSIFKIPNIFRIFVNGLCAVIFAPTLSVLFFTLLVCVISTGCKEDNYKFDFDHQKHVKFTAKCLDCHGSDFEYVVKSGHEQCRKCHEFNDEILSNDCLLCHNTLDKQTGAGIQKTNYSLVEIDHESHAQKGVSCSKCHGRVENQNRLTEINFILMEGCVNCHFPGIYQIKDIDCGICHFNMSHTIPTKDHEAMQWITTHGNQSITDPNMCARCHNETDCTTCHSSTMPKFHTVSFRTRGHGANASVRPDQCAVCHKQDFCLFCHLSSQPVYHTVSFKTSKPYTHCGMCHIPVSAGNRCIVCHKKARHDMARSEAPPPPDFVDKTLPCFYCHPVNIVPVPHLYNTIPDVECIYCH